MWWSTLTSIAYFSAHDPYAFVLRLVKSLGDTVPTNKPRVSWILSEDVISDMKLLCAAHYRPIAMEAELALREYITKMRIEQPEIFDVEYSKDNPY